MRNRPDALMIFAAGFGTRMGALTADRPKPLVEVAGESLLDRALGLGRAAQPTHIVANAHYRGEQIAAHLAGTEVRVVHEQPDILDTGGGLRNALPLLGPGPVWTLNPDAVWRGPNPLIHLAEAWQDGMGALLLLIPRDRARAHGGRGDFALDGDRPVRGGPLVYTGAQIVDPAGLDAIPDAAFSLNRYWDLLAGEARLHATVYDGDWCDVGHPGGVTEAERMLAGVDA